MSMVADFTSRAVTGQMLAAAGFVGCCRYIKNTPGSTFDKEIHAAEVAEKSAAGCRVGANFEWGERPTDSIATGQRHAGVFLQWCADVGAPDWAPCYFSLDANNPAGAYHAYFTGIVREIGLARSGVYGNGACYRSLLSADLVTLTWQSKSHSYAGNSATGPWPDTTMVQRLATQDVGGHQVDVNDTLTSYWGGWLLGEDDPTMPTAEEIATAVWELHKIPNTVTGTDVPASRFLTSLNRQVNDIHELSAADIAAAVVAALPPAEGGWSATEVEAAVRAAITGATITPAPPA